MTARLIRHETWFETFALVVAGGLLLSVIAFGLTSGTPVYTYLGLYQHMPPVFDMWTGQPHGGHTIQVFDFTSGAPLSTPIIVSDDPLPAELEGRWAIPLPVGFPLGCAVTLGALAVIRVRYPDTSGIAGSATAAR